MKKLWSILNAKPKHSRKGARAGEGGMALLMVITMVAVLTSLVVEFSYDVRVDTSLAAHARDELRAHYLARSSFNLSRLLLSFQNQLDGQTAGLSQQLGAAMGALGGGGGLPGGAAGMASAIGNIRLWELLPIESSAITGFTAAIAGEPAQYPLSTAEPTEPGEAVTAAGLSTFGTFEGAFSAQITDEETKLNLNKLNLPRSAAAVAAAQLMLAWRDPRWNFLFEEENSEGDRYTREDIILHLKDFVDQDQVGTGINRVGGITDLLVDGFGDEEAPYQGLTPLREPKNAIFETMDELYLVPGIDDRFMAAFGDKLTVFADVNAGLNVNTGDPFLLYIAILSVAENPDDPRLADPLLLQRVIEGLQELRSLGGFVGINKSSFISVLQAAGIPVRSDVVNNPTNGWLGDKSQTFTIKAVGQVGDVEKVITAVIRYDQYLGKLLYFRED